MHDAVGGLESATVVEFFRRMNEQGVEYALLRNYEQYPKFSHDIDLVVRWSHLQPWREIARGCAADFEWDALTECDHWAQSSSPGHAIQILRFYRKSPLHYLQIDAFHAQLVNSLPLLDEEALLRGRIWDERGFYRIDEQAENFFRLFQIARLAGIPDAHARAEVYRSRALPFWARMNGVGSYCAAIGFPDMTAALRDLEAGDLASFKSKVDRHKRTWWLAKMLAHPLRGSRMLLDRFADYVRLYELRPCGFTLRVAASAEQRRQLDAALARLIDTNFILLYSLGGSRKKRHQAMERGGIAVLWEPAQCAEWVLDSTASEDAIFERLLTMLIERHPRILGP